MVIAGRKGFNPNKKAAGICSCAPVGYHATQCTHSNIHDQIYLHKQCVATKSFFGWTGRLSRHSPWRLPCQPWKLTWFLYGHFRCSQTLSSWSLSSCCLAYANVCGQHWHARRKWPRTTHWHTLQKTRVPLFSRDTLLKRAWIFAIATVCVRHLILCSDEMCKYKLIISIHSFGAIKTVAI